MLTQQKLAYCIFWGLVLQADSGNRLRSSSISQHRIRIVDELNHLLYSVPLHKAQSDTLSRWLDFRLAVGQVELSKIDAFEARGDRHVTSTADMLAIVDGLIGDVSVLVYPNDLSIDLVKAETKLSLSATSAARQRKLLAGLCFTKRCMQQIRWKIILIFLPVRRKLDEFVHRVFLLDGHCWLTFLLFHKHPPPICWRSWLVDHLSSRSWMPHYLEN